MLLTNKDSLILAQSQLERAIELCTLIGFPDTVKTNSDKIKHIAEVVVPYLMKTTVNNADKYLASTIDTFNNVR